jgi:hypothetical protein
MKVLDATFGVAFALLSAGALSACSCNWRRFRRERACSPLDDLDLEPIEAPRDAPKTWDPPGRVNDARRALGYASVAENRYVNCLLIGEVLLLIAGAGLGAAVASTPWRHAAAESSAGIFLLVGAGGVALRMRANRVWEPVERRYRERYRQLVKG